MGDFENAMLLLIFATGLIVLALEVLASRIMTPYFGVSLYIWAGILSSTLSFLAIGYYLGGILSRRSDRAGMTSLFCALPTISAASILAVATIYPITFPYLAQANLVAGSFVASAALLAMPLVCLSAMNPLLIAIRRAGSKIGDGGAGQVFFVSTIGSVAGVIVTVFVIIPNLTNFNALLWLALALCLATGVFSVSTSLLSPGQKQRLIWGTVAVALVSSLLIAGRNQYLEILAGVNNEDPVFTVTAEYTSLFGNIKIVEVHFPSDKQPPIKIYMQDGIFQNRVTLDNVSVSMYTYVLDQLAAIFVPQSQDALVLGLGAGIVPQDLKTRGMDVTVVDINPDALSVATEHFGFDPSGFVLHLKDARTFVRECVQAFDVIVVDLTQGDSTPDHLLTAEFFGDVRRCLRAGGAVVMNAFFDDQDDTPNRRLLATIAASFDQVVEFHLPDANSFVVGSTATIPGEVVIDSGRIPAPLVGIVRRSLQSGRLVAAETLLEDAPITDQHNLASILLAHAQMRKRRVIVELLPPRMLIN